jgi:hypothetical protein
MSSGDGIDTGPILALEPIIGVRQQIHLLSAQSISRSSLWKRIVSHEIEFSFLKLRSLTRPSYSCTGVVLYLAQPVL